MGRLAHIILVAAVALPARAALLDVYPDGSGLYPDIEAALVAADPGDTISLAPGTFSGSGNRNLVFGGGDLSILSSDGDAATCIIDCEGQGRAFLVHSTPGTTIRIEGLTVRGGDPSAQPEDMLPGSGGALAVVGIGPGGLVTIVNCIFEHNSAEAGGGAYLWETEAKFIECILRENLATDGGGVYAGHCQTGAGIRFEHCLIHGNDYPRPEVGGYGAGIYFSHSAGGLTACTLADNRAWFGAGLLVSTDSNVDVAGSLFALNPQGEGLAVHNGEVSIEACDIFGNAGGDWVGAIADRLGLDCNVTADPFFCDAGGGDFSLRGDSPCLPENSGGCGLIGALPLGCPDPAGVGISPPASSILMLRGFPNPANPRMTIQFALSRSAQVDLAIHDLNGRRLRRLLGGHVPAGRRILSWDGCDDDGRTLSSGVYLLKLDTVTENRISRLTLIR